MPCPPGGEEVKTGICAKKLKVPGSRKGEGKSSSFLWIRGLVGDLSGGHTWRTIVPRRMAISQGSLATKAKGSVLNRNKQNKTEQLF